MQVVLEIAGAEADLTIIDLPGIIHDHPAGRQYVELVELMTRINLAPEHHIIAMALPAGLDQETQVRAEDLCRLSWWACVLENSRPRAQRACMSVVRFLSLCSSSPST